MTPYFEVGDIQIYHGDARKVLSELDVEATACVTDPPYGLAFMGRDWDDFDPLEYQTWCRDWAEVVKGSMRPGAPLLAFSGTRTFHRAICGIEDAGFTIKDCLSWTYGSGFPKSHDLSKAVDQHKGKKEEREVVREDKHSAERKAESWQASSQDSGMAAGNEGKRFVTAPATDEAETWDGYGTALAPSWEPICYATKPREGTYAENALEHGVAGLNIDGGRLETEEDTRRPAGNMAENQDKYGHYEGEQTNGTGPDKGRWPANVIFDEPAAAELDAEVGAKAGSGDFDGVGRRPGGFGDVGADSGSSKPNAPGYNDTGGPSRYFYTSKASKADRNAGLPPGEENDHPTVKPTDLMGWLLRLIEMPEENLILDPFLGSGTTLYVCQQMGLPAIGIDQSEEACELASKRLSEPSLFS